MSLNKTRKRAIARARRRSEMPAQKLLPGYTVEQITEAMRAIGRVAQAVSDGLVAFGKAFNESLRKS